jgi:Sap, sulfolipid-1-addressing protein
VGHNPLRSASVVDSGQGGRSSAMWQALGGLLPIAVAVAFSSVPITVTILILLSPNRNRAALPFLVGWVIGVTAVIVFSTLFASALPAPPRRGPDPALAVLSMLVGAALVVLGVINLRRSSQSESIGLSGWLSRVDSFGALASFAVAVLLNFRPKGLLLGIAAGLALHAAAVKANEIIVLIVIYTVIASSTVVVPIVASFLAPRRVEPRLIAVRGWMTHNGRLLTSLMMLMIGVVILGYGLTQL